MAGEGPRPIFDRQAGRDVNVKGVCPAAFGTKHEAAGGYSPDTQLVYVPTNHVCNGLRAVKVSYTGRPALCRATAFDVPPPRRNPMGKACVGPTKFGTDRHVGRNKEQFSVVSGALANRRRRGVLRNARRLSEGSRRQRRARACNKFKDPRRHYRQRHEPMSRGAGSTWPCCPAWAGWAGSGLAAGLTTRRVPLMQGVRGRAAAAVHWIRREERGHRRPRRRRAERALSNYTRSWITLTVFALPQ